MVCRQAVHENRIPGILHHFAVYLIRHQVFDTLHPYRIRLAHRNPYVGADDVRILCSILYVFGQRNAAAGLLCNFLTLLNQCLIREITGRSAGGKVHAHLRTYDHVGIAHVVAGVSHINQLHAFQLSKMLANRQKVRQHLGRMELVGQTVPYRNACIFCKLFYDFLSVTAVFNSFKHPSQNACGVADALFFADLGAGRIKVGTSHAKIVCSNLKGAAGSRAGLFKNQCNIFSPQCIDRNACFFEAFQLRCEVNEIVDFLRRIIQ